MAPSLYFCLSGSVWSHLLSRGGWRVAAKIAQCSSLVWVYFHSLFCIFGMPFPSSSSCLWIPRNLVGFFCWWFLPIDFFCSLIQDPLLSKSQTFWTPNRLIFFRFHFPFLYPLALYFREFPQSSSVEYFISANILLMNKNSFFPLWIFLFL